uniref:EF-hand domain-containing protein n=1 Tax=Branchiostoma floridae TaxID=7739 RepID=C3ZWJ7_BRAFL|eukprot:XP_002587055.1 hypothetical protein BRAFLDRAFT_102974 [Branchiostoma floridae]
MSPGVLQCHQVCCSVTRVVEEDRGLLQLLQGEQKGFSLRRREFGGHGVNWDSRLSQEEAQEMLRKMRRDVSKLPADWFTSMDTNGNGFIDLPEYNMAETLY